MDYLLKLNEKQLEAVQNTEGYLRVIAGAGSGKTKLLVSRYAYLVKEYGIDTPNILCVTFTNKAAGEMKRRIKALIGEGNDTSLICTYHGFCVKVLREDIEKIFYPREFQIADSAQQKAILEEIYQKYELKLDHGSFEKAIKQISGYKKMNRGYVERMCCTDRCQIKDEVVTLDDKIAEDYMQYQKRLFIMDFDDLIYFTLDVFARCPEVLEKWQDRLNYIQVDEFQDSSSLEMELIELLSKKYENLMIVGDPDQNIYEWRGSDVNLLVDFDKRYPTVNTVFLNQNYRSTPQILKCANTLIEKNRFRLKKELFTKTGAGDEVYHFHLENEYAEAEKIVRTILEIRKKTDCNFDDFAVLYRSGFLSRVIEKKFTEEGIPYEIFGGVKFYHRMEVQDVIAYLRLLAFDDDIALKRIINKPRRRFGRAKMQALSAMQTEKSLFQTLKDNIDNPVFKSSGAREFVEIIESARKSMKDLSLSDTVAKICDTSGYEKYIRELGDMERLENFAEFGRIAAEYESSMGETVPLDEFINHISLQSDDESEENADRVKLMTIHAAKGLEFPNVFVVGMSEGVFPSAKTVEARKELGLEEERRLCYVAITRAEKRLFLMDSEGYNQNGRQKLPSRFLFEIGEENYIRKGTISRELRESAENYARELSGEEPCENKNKGIGDVVYHPAFGKGEIVGYDKCRGSIRVKFDNLKTERILASDFFDRERKLPVVERHEEEPMQEEIAKTYAESKNENSAPPSNNTSGDDEKQPVPKEIINVRTEKRYRKTETTSELKKETDKEPPEPKMNKGRNLWQDESGPKSGWMCTGVTDLGAPVGVCEMCGQQGVRYVHHMVHPNYQALDVGCICAGKLEGDIEAAKLRESEFKSRKSRFENFMKRKWKESKNNNSYVKIKDHVIILYFDRKNGGWKFSIDGVFSKNSWQKKAEAKKAAFEMLEKLLKIEKC